MGLNYQNHRRLREFSTFGIGGPIRLFAEVKTIEEMEEGLRFANRENIPFFILGKGSNCLFSDRGFDGLVLLNKIDFCTWNENCVDVGSGYSFSLLGVLSAKKGLSGLEFASGIPASVGGAVFMNAGANGCETCNSLRSVLYLYADGRKKEFHREEMSFQYRSSSFQSMKGVILSSVFELTPFPKARQKQLQIISYRMKTQPLKEKSAGCIFRNAAKGVTAGELIERCGLKGFAIGGAKVSEIHANFIVNDHHATAQNVVHLIQEIQTQVYNKTGVRLEPEIRIFQNA